MHLFEFLFYENLFFFWLEMIITFVVRRACVFFVFRGDWARQKAERMVRPAF